MNWIWMSLNPPPFWLYFVWYFQSSRFNISLWLVPNQKTHILKLARNWNNLSLVSGTGLFQGNHQCWCLLTVLLPKLFCFLPLRPAYIILPKIEWKMVAANYLYSTRGSISTFCLKIRTFLNHIAFMFIGKISLMMTRWAKLCINAVFLTN